MSKVRITLVVVMIIALLQAVSGLAATSGIWKSADNVYSFYIQTYSGGEGIVIATKDGAEFYVFLDSAVDDGIDVEEYFGKSADLEVAFEDDSSANANLVIKGIPNTFQIEKSFEADCRSLGAGGSTESSSGIWKSESPADSFYVQTYTTGSAIFVETADGVNFNVFLDGDVADGIAAQEYFGRSASLSVTFQSSSQASAYVTKNGAIPNYDISRLFVDDCRNVQSTPVSAPEIAHAAVYTLKGFGSQWLGVGAEIVDESGDVETGATAWVIGPASLYVPLRFDPGVRFYNDDDAGLSILKGDYTFHAEKNGVEAVPVTKTLNTVYVIEPPVFKTYASPQVGQPWTLQWEAVAGAKGYFVFFKYRDEKTCLWKNAESTFALLPSDTSVTIPGEFFTANSDYEIMVVASEENYIENTSAASIAGVELTTKP